MQPSAGRAAAGRWIVVCGAGAGAASRSTARKIPRRMTYVKAAPTSDSGTITTAYAMKPRPASSATIMFIGFDTTNGATPGARNTTNANATVTCGARG